MNIYCQSLRSKELLENIVIKTPLEKNEFYSKQHNANIYFKREDLQVGRSYKIRGAYSKIRQLNNKEKAIGVVCASAGNHAQGVSIACSMLDIKGIIFMPITTPKQKIRKVVDFGGENIKIELVGDSFDQTKQIAIDYSDKHNKTFIHPFDDQKVIAGQGTVGLEIIDQKEFDIDMLIVPIGGGGLAAGICEVFKTLSPKTKIIGVEPNGAPSMSSAINNKKPTLVSLTDNFVDGAAVKKVGDLNYKLCVNSLEKIITVCEGRISSVILKLYNEQGIVVEPAGALTISALELLKQNELRDKNVVCIISGGNNDISRTEEIKERALIYEELKHYFLINFPQRPGALRDFVTQIIGPKDDITFFQFSKKHNKETGPAVVGIELSNKQNLGDIYRKMKTRNYQYEYLNQNSLLFNQLIG